MQYQNAVLMFEYVTNFQMSDKNTRNLGNSWSKLFSTDCGGHVEFLPMSLAVSRELHGSHVMSSPDLLECVIALLKHNPSRLKPPRKSQIPV